MYKILLTTAAALTFAAPAQAAITFFSLGAVNSADPGLRAFETELVNFNTTTNYPGVTVALGGAAGYYTGTSGSAAAPVGDTSQYLALGTGGTATIDFTTYFTAMQHRVRSLSVYVGSVDQYNKIEVLEAGTGNILKTINGADLPGQNGDQGSALTNRRLYINFDPAAPTDQVGALRFSSTGVAFEFDTIGASSAKFAIPSNVMIPPNNLLPSVTGVPEPTMWSLMIGGFGLVGGALRRRARAVLKPA